MLPEVKIVKDFKNGGLKIMVSEKGYDYRIGLKKFGINAVAVILAGLAAVYGDNIYYLALAPLLKLAENFIKHRN